MKIKSVRIENFRSFQDEEIPLNDYACLVGSNGAGKSTVLTALNVFFRESENTSTNLNLLTEEDFHCKNTEQPIRITVTFTGLSEEAQQDFSDYSRQGELVVSATAEYNKDTGKAEIKQYGQRKGMEAFAKFFQAEGKNAKVAELKKIYADIQESHPDLPPPSTKDAMKNALRTYEDEHPDQCALLPSEDQFYGFSRGANRLAKHLQWVYIPAIKDPTGEQVEAKNSALGKLLARTVRSKTNFDEAIGELRKKMQNEYQGLLDENQNILQEISDTLETRLSEWAHPDTRLQLLWKQDSEKSVRVEEPWAHIIAGEGGFDGELARFGHGFQRSFLLALLQLLAETGETDAPTLILACEEPELYQHPPQARHLAKVLFNLSKSSSQILVSTHNPLFVSGIEFENVRMVRKDMDTSSSSVAHVTFSEIATKMADVTGKQHSKPNHIQAEIHQALQANLSEMFFTSRLILVEGLEDMAYLSTYFALLDLSEEYRRKGFHIIPTHSKSRLIQPLLIARHMNIPTYVVFDADTDKEDRNGSRKKHETDNRALLKLLEAPDEAPMPDSTVWGKNFTMWKSNISAVVEADIGKDWATFQERASNIYGCGRKSKNILHVGETLALAFEDGKRSYDLEKLCHKILEL